MDIRCLSEKEESGGPHSWFVRCGRSLGHAGPCEFYMNHKEMIAEGTVKVDVASVIRSKRAEIVSLQSAITKLEIEVNELLDAEVKRIKSYLLNADRQNEG